MSNNLSENNVKPQILIPGSEHFLIPYLEAAFKGAEIIRDPSAVSPDGVDTAVIILGNGGTLPESISCRSVVAISSATGTDTEAEATVTEAAKRLGAPLAILRPAEIIGTGMTGLPRDIVNRIYRGTFFHIADANEPRISVIHALDVARAATVAAGHEGIFTLSDGSDPTLKELAEALSHRLGHKRIYSLSGRKARMLARLFPSIIISGDRKVNMTDSPLFADFRPLTVTDYLTNHHYDENDI